MSRPGTTYHPVQGYIKRETDKAMLMEVTTVGGQELPDLPKNFWFPFSQIQKIIRQAPNVQEPDEIHVAEWILSSKGLV